VGERWDKLVFVSGEGAERKAVCWGQGISPLAPLVYTGTMETAACVDWCFSVSAGNCKHCGEHGQGEKTTDCTWGGKLSPSRVLLGSLGLAALPTTPSSERGKRWLPSAIYIICVFLL